MRRKISATVSHTMYTVWRLITDTNSQNYLNSLQNIPAIHDLPFNELSESQWHVHGLHKTSNLVSPLNFCLREFRDSEWIFPYPMRGSESVLASINPEPNSLRQKKLDQAYWRHTQCNMLWYIYSLRFTSVSCFQCFETCNWRSWNYRDVRNLAVLERRVDRFAILQRRICMKTYEKESNGERWLGWDCLLAKMDER